MGVSLLLRLSGNAAELLNHVQRAVPTSNWEVLQVEEKMLIKLGKMFRAVRPVEKAQFLFVGCKAMDTQRYLFIMKSYMLFSRAHNKLFIDEQGRMVEFSVSTYFFLDLPAFIWEVMSSLAVVAIEFVKLKFTQLRTRR